MILTFAFDGTAEASPNTGVEYSQGQVFGFLVLICAPIGLALGGIVALIFDRRSRRHTHEVAVDHASVHVDPEPGTNGHGARTEPPRCKDGSVTRAGAVPQSRRGA